MGEPIAFHLHKNRLFLDKLAKKEEPPLTTKEILKKIDTEMLIVDAKVNKALAKREKLRKKQERDKPEP